MRRTQQSSIEALEKAIEEQKNTRDFNYINDLKMLRKQYTCTLFISAAWTAAVSSVLYLSTSRSNSFR